MANRRKLEFGETITKMAAIHGVEVDKAMLAGYWDALESMGQESLDRAVREANRTLKWFPKPAELIELAGGLGSEHRARLAWAEVALAAKSSSWPIDPMAVKAVAHMGGPSRLGAMKETELEVWGRK